MSIFRKHHWRKVILHTSNLDWIDLAAFAWNAADRLWQGNNPPLYYASYSDPKTGKQRVEIQIESDRELEFYTAFFAGTVVDKVEVSVCEGSPAHAAAYLLARELRGGGEALTEDVIHWTFNMTGYIYLQEVRLHGAMTARLAGYLEHE